ncbi:MAG: efflux RND transporter permease subunit, partial [Alphaproteobacteria bacterium]
MISRFFIDRPIFASVISIIIVLAGLMALRVLPVAQYPEILPTTIEVSTTYMGANAETVANTVAAPLEQQINGVENMLYMSSSSSNSGQLSITVTFAVGTNPAQAEIDVNNRVQAALALLPDEVRQAGVTVKRKSGAILEVITLSSPDNSKDTLYMSNYAALNILDELKRIKGVGDASLFGALNYSMRIWLYPDKLAHYKLTPQDIASALSEQNAQFALGQIGQQPMKNSQDFTYSLTTQGRFSNVKEFEDIIVKSNSNGSSLKLKDVARVELGGQNYDFISKIDGTPAVAMGIYLQTGANAIDTTNAVNERIEELSKNFPQGIKYTIPFDTTTFVKVSIKEVIKTFVEAILLVTIVVFLFLQNVRATLI